MAIINAFPSGGSGAGALINVVIGGELPTPVVNGEIVVISDTAGSVTFDTVTPVSPTAGQIYIRMGSASDILALSSGVNLNIRPIEAMQYDGTAWSKVSAYLGIAGSWVQFSESVTIMGVQYDTSGSSPTLVRIDDAVGRNATAGIGPVMQESDFDQMAIYKDMRLCNVNSSMQVLAYEGDANFRRDGSNGDVMVEIPKFYISISLAGSIETWRISDGPHDGFYLHPAFNRPGGVRDCIYVGAYETGSGYTSKSGVAPLVSITRAQARTGSRGRGSNWCELDIAAVGCVNLLMYIEYATLDMQGAVGAGNSNTAAAINTGGSDSMAGHTGRPSGTPDAIAVKYRGIENWWGNVWAWVDGLNINGGAYYYCLNPEQYADDTTTNYTTASQSIGTALSASYIKTMGLTEGATWLRLPTTGGGSGSTYYCDSVWTSTAWRVARLGGDWAAGSSCGPAAWILSNTSSDADTYSGCRLLGLPSAA